MSAAELPDNEAARLDSLKSLNALDTELEDEFQVLVQIAALVCQVPIALVSLIDADRQWF